MHNLRRLVGAAQTILTTLSTKQLNRLGYNDA